MVEIEVYRLDSSSKESGVISVITSFDLESPMKALPTSVTPLSLSTVFTKSSPECIKGLHWALSCGRPVDIDIQATLSDSLLEGFEDTITSASADITTLPPIVLCMVLYLPFIRCIDYRVLDSQHFTSPS